MFLVLQSPLQAYSYIFKTRASRSCQAEWDYFCLHWNSCADIWFNFYIYCYLIQLLYSFTLSCGVFASNYSGAVAYSSGSARKVYVKYILKKKKEKIECNKQLIWIMLIYKKNFIGVTLIKVNSIYIFILNITKNINTRIHTHLYTDARARIHTQSKKSSFPC